VQPLREVGQSVTAAIEQINGAAQRLQGAEAGAQTLAQALTTAAQRFDGLDRELGKVVDRLTEGLQNFTQQISKFVSGTDQNMAKAATQLHGAIAELTDVLDDHRRPPKAA
jgi:ABC-type transporter Mla subunit MlaD